MKVWTIHTTSTESCYNTYRVEAETQEEAMEKYHNGEADFYNSDNQEMIDESFEDIEMFEDLDPFPDDMKMDEGL